MDHLVGFDRARKLERDSRLFSADEKRWQVLIDQFQGIGRTAAVFGMAVADIQPERSAGKPSGGVHQVNRESHGGFEGHPRGGPFSRERQDRANVDGLTWRGRLLRGEAPDERKEEADSSSGGYAARLGWPWRGAILIKG